MAGARLVFASSIGTPVEPRNVNRRWDELRRRAGLNWLRLHDLRHGCARLLLAKGVPDRVITEVPGRPTPWMSCSERDVSDFGNSKGHFMIGSGLLPGALGGTRTPNLLIRRSMESVRPVRRNPYPQVSVPPGVRHRCHSPVPSGQSVRKL
jgi:hypothetical protein